MKITTFFIGLTAASVTAFLLACVFGQYASTFFMVAACSFFLLIVAKDYAPRRYRCQLSEAPVPRASRRAQRWRLAA